MLDRIFDLAKINNTIAHFSKKMCDLYYNYLINEFGVSFTYHSNRIEGVNTTLTLNDTKKILNNTYDFKGVVDKEKQREINETMNHQEAFKYIFEIIKQDIDIIGTRGERLVDYAFSKGFSLPNTLNILYSQLTKSDDVEEMFQNLTFSELALARDLFSEL